MSYEHKRTLEYGEEVINATDREGRTPTDGPVVMGVVEAKGEAAPIRLNNNNEVVISNLEMLELFEDMRKELTLIRMHMSMITEMNINKDEVE